MHRVNHHHHRIPGRNYCSLLQHSCNWVGLANQQPTATSASPVCQPTAATRSIRHKAVIDCPSPHLGSLSFKSAGTVDEPSARSSLEEMWHTPISLSPPITAPCTRRSAPFWKHLDTKLTSNNRSSGRGRGCGGEQDNKHVTVPHRAKAACQVEREGGEGEGGNCRRCPAALRTVYTHAQESLVVGCSASKNDARFTRR